jgi:hypothetical protein
VPTGTLPVELTEEDADGIGDEVGTAVVLTLADPGPVSEGDALPEAVLLELRVPAALPECKELGDGEPLTDMLEYSVDEADSEVEEEPLTLRDSVAADDADKEGWIVMVTVADCGEYVAATDVLESCVRAAEAEEENKSLEVSIAVDEYAWESVPDALGEARSEKLPLAVAIGVCVPEADCADTLSTALMVNVGLIDKWAEYDAVALAQSEPAEDSDGLAVSYDVWDDDADGFAFEAVAAPVNCGLREATVVPVSSLDTRALVEKRGDEDPTPEAENDALEEYVGIGGADPVAVKDNSVKEDTAERVGCSADADTLDVAVDVVENVPRGGDGVDASELRAVSDSRAEPVAPADSTELPDTPAVLVLYAEGTDDAEDSIDAVGVRDGRALPVAASRSEEGVCSVLDVAVCAAALIVAAKPSLALGAMLAIVEPLDESVPKFADALLGAEGVGEAVENLDTREDADPVRLDAAVALRKAETRDETEAIDDTRAEEVAIADAVREAVAVRGGRGQTGTQALCDAFQTARGPQLVFAHAFTRTDVATSHMRVILL